MRHSGALRRQSDKLSCYDFALTAFQKALSDLVIITTGRLSKRLAVPMELDPVNAATLIDRSESRTALFHGHLCSDGQFALLDPTIKVTNIQEHSASIPNNRQRSCGNHMLQGRLGTANVNRGLLDCQQPRPERRVRR